MSSGVQRETSQRHSKFAFTYEMTAVSHCDKKGKPHVIVISSLHHDDKVADDEKKKPTMISDYDQTKEEVNIVDKMCRYYSVKVKTCR